MPDDVIDNPYEFSLHERIQTVTAEELKIVLSFFDCAPLRQWHVALIQELREELGRRGVVIP